MGRVLSGRAGGPPDLVARNVRGQPARRQRIAARPRDSTAAW